MLFSELTLTSTALQLLRSQLAMPGRLRGGLLFGRPEGESVNVHVISSLGPHWYLRPELGPLALEAGYVLGWSDSLAATHGGRIDWVGQWIAQADNRLPDIRDDLRWLTQAARLGLVDAQHPLLVVGWEDGYLHGRAYGYDEGEAVEWRCQLSTPRRSDQQAEEHQG